MLAPASDYATLAAQFRWRIPDRYNIGVDVCDRWAAQAPDRAAILEVGDGGRVAPLTYRDLRDASNRLARALGDRGIGRGDRVAILLPQCATVAVAHVAVYKLGAVALPLAALFGVDALSYRLRDAGAKALVTNAAGLAKLGEIADPLPDLAVILSTDGADGRAEGLAAVLEGPLADFTPVDTAADDPAMMIYTSGTTGQPKGALHAHRVLLGHLPGVQMPHEFLPQPGDRLWTPADWAWAGGLLNVLLPGLHFGVPVVAKKFEKFDPEEAFRLMAEQGIRNSFVPPTALRMLRTVRNPAGRFDLKLRTIASGGEALGAETFAWGREALGITINEFYGQTECNLVLSSCAAIGVAKAGAIGKPVPGHRVGDRPGRRDALRSGRTRPDRRHAAGSGDVPVLLEQARRDGGQVRRRLDDDGRPGPARRGRLYPFHRPRRRRDHVVGLPHRPRRDRGLPHPPPGRRARGGGRQARSRAHRDRQGLRGAEGGAQSLGALWRPTSRPS